MRNLPEWTVPSITSSVPKSCDVRSVIEWNAMMACPSAGKRNSANPEWTVSPRRNVPAPRWGGRRACWQLTGSSGCVRASPVISLRPVSSRLPLPVLFDSLNLLRRTFAVLPSLVDQCGGHQLRDIKLADGESFEPSFLPACEALELRPSHVPELDVHAIGSTLAEEEGRHRSSLGWWRIKGKRR